MKVNCHIIVGLGETDRELVDLFYQLKEEQIAGYLFSFNPEPETAMQNAPRAPLHRLRRPALGFDSHGGIELLDAPREIAAVALEDGLPFMTNGCPDKDGVMACN